MYLFILLSDLFYSSHVIYWLRLWVPLNLCIYDPEWKERGKMWLVLNNSWFKLIEFCVFLSVCTYRNFQGVLLHPSEVTSFKKQNYFLFLTFLKYCIRFHWWNLKLTQTTVHCSRMTIGYFAIKFQMTIWIFFKVIFKFTFCRDVNGNAIVNL